MFVDVWIANDQFYYSIYFARNELLLLVQSFLNSIIEINTNYKQYLIHFTNKLKLILS